MTRRPGMAESSRRKAHRALRIVLVVALLQALVVVVSPAHSREQSQNSWEFITPHMTAPVTATFGGEDQASKPEFVGKLGRGDALFWEGPYLDSIGTATRYSDPSLCESQAATQFSCGYGTDHATPTWVVNETMRYPLGQEESPFFCGTEQSCFAYSFDVTEPGDVLRVALDQPSLRDLIWLYVYAPGETTPVTKLYRSWQERWIPSPKVGRWVVRVLVDDARDTSFRMRAALDPNERGHGRERAARKQSGLLLPNLQVSPPHELGFGPCQATEIVDYGAQRCLRFSTGPANAGDGPLDLLVTDTGSLEGQMYQRLHRADGTTETVAAGTFEYHAEHAHYHHGALQSLELLRVTDPRRGVMEAAGAGPKLGFCLLPYHIVEWDTFAQDPPFSVYDDDACGGFVREPAPTQMALARGFMDIYPWWVEGNFVDFGDNPDGEYVIRAASDPDGNIRETRDDDNVAYTHIRVTGDEIEVLERGIGTDPWDPHGVVVDDNRRPTRWEE